MTTLSRLLDLAALPAGDIPDSARTMARFSLFDWMVCGRAGAGEPLAGILRAYVLAEGGRPVASVSSAAGQDAGPGSGAGEWRDQPCAGL